MSNDTGKNRLWAYALIILGALLLAANLGWVGAMSNWVWALLFIGGGAAFLQHYFFKNRQAWWALIPGFALAATGLTMLLGNAGGPIFMALLAAGFLAVFLSNKQRWWAVIPGGILATLAVVDWLELVNPRLDTGWVFFLGVAATFGFLYFRPDGGARLNWAVWPAVAGLGVALLSFVSTSAGGIVAPLVLIGLGVYLFTRGTEPQGDIPAQKEESP